MIKKGKVLPDCLLVCLMACLMACLLALGLCGCGAGGSAGAGVSLKEMQKAMVSADAALPSMETVFGGEADAEVTFTYLCDFDYERVEYYFYSYAAEGTGHEIAVVLLKDPSDAALLMKDLKTHVESRKGTMENYAPDQVELVDHYLLVREGAAIALIICDDPGPVQHAFESFF